MPPQTEEIFQRPHCGVAQPSILFPQNTSYCDLERPDQPACFPDLNFDQVVAAVATGREDYDLEPLFYSTFRDDEVIRFRHDVFLRAERLAKGERTFRLLEGEPLPTSYGRDLYRRILEQESRTAEMEEENRPIVNDRTTPARGSAPAGVR